MSASISLVLIIILVALVFDFINGFHDSANSIATVVSTRVLSPAVAVMWAAFFNFIAAFTSGRRSPRPSVPAHPRGVVDVTVVRRADGRHHLGPGSPGGLACPPLHRAPRRLRRGRGSQAGALIARLVKPILFIFLSLDRDDRRPDADHHPRGHSMSSPRRAGALPPAAAPFRRRFSLSHGANDAQKRHHVSLPVATQALFAGATGWRPTSTFEC
jgi:hypothetical protein